MLFLIKIFLEPADSVITVPALLLKLRSCNIKCTSAKRNRNGFVIFCDTYKDSDKIFSKNATEELKTLKCTPKLPKELKNIYYH